MFKPPFLTEMEAINDCVNSIYQLKNMGVPAVDLEIMTIQEETLVYKLWE